MTQPLLWLQEPVLSPRLVLRPGRDAAADRAAAVELLTDPRIRQLASEAVATIIGWVAEHLDDEQVLLT